MTVAMLGTDGGRVHNDGRLGRDGQV